MKHHVLCLCWLALWLAGCAATPPIETYTLLPPVPAVVPGAPASAAVLVVIPEARGQGLVVGTPLVERRGLRLVPDLYRCWSPRPSLMLAYALADAVNHGAEATAVVEYNADARWKLSTTIHDWSYQNSPSGLVAQIAINAELVDLPARRMAGQRTYAQSALAAAHSYEALVSAFQQCLLTIARRCADDAGHCMRAAQ